MDQPTVNKNLENKPNDIDFQDLEALLQQGLGNTELKVIDRRTECLLPAGENYSSLVIKIDATIRWKDDAEKEDVHVVAKAKIPTLDYEDAWISIIKKEIFAYTKLLPMYRDIEKEAGVPDSDLIDILPKYMGHRISRKNNGKYDKDALILMENLKVKGYYNVDRQIGLDLQSAKKALSSLARYHALGMAVKQKHPSFAQIIIENAEAKLDNPEIEHAYDVVRKAFQKYSRLTVYMDFIESSITHMVAKWYSEERKPAGQWHTISHGDFWTNNMLFHKSDEGEVDDVKFVDWAMYFHVSALADVPYFLCTSVQQVILDSHFDDLLDVYYESFVATLERVGCDAKQFTRESFDAELKKQALNEIAFSVLAIKFVHYEVDKKDQENRELFKNVYEMESDVYEASLTRIIEIYKAWKWL